MLRSFWIRHFEATLQTLHQRARRRVRISQRGLELLEPRVLPAITVTFNYSLDGNNFFAPASPQRVALEAAVNDVAANLNDTLLEIIPHKDNPADTWTATVTNPSTGGSQAFSDLILGENEILIYPGARQLGTVQLGEGGFGAVNVGGTQSFVDLVLGRGQAGALGPAAGQSDFAVTAGSMAFDIDANWFFGLNPADNTTGQADFYSVAQHEFAHLIGFGTSESFKNLASGTSFGGPVSSAEYDGGGNPPLSSDQAHWADGTTDDGREVAMDPSLLLGSRKTLSKLDYAALADLGWDVSAGAGTGGGGPLDPRQIKLSDGSPHVLVVQDDSISGNGMSEYVLDGGTPISFPTDGGAVTLTGGDMADDVTVLSLDSSFAGSFTINTAAGDDTLQIDHGAKDGLTVSGGSGSDTMQLSGASATTSNFQFTGAASGTSLINDGTTTTISFSEFEAVTDSVTASNRAFGFSAGADSVTLQDDGSANGSSQLTSVTSSPTVTFANPTTGLSFDVGAGNDVVTLAAMDSAFAASVTMIGGDGNDSIDGTLANYATTLDGGTGADTLTGSSLGDSILGGSDNDSISGLSGNDIILSGIGNDTLSGGDGTDLLNAGNGNDVLSGGAGNDTLTAGGGTDTVSESADVNFTLTSTTLIGAGTDTLNSIEAASLTGGGSANVIDVSAFNGPATVMGGAGADSITGSNFNDSLVGDEGNDTINAGSGNDFVLGGDGDDSVTGGVGADGIDAGDGNDVVSGDAGNDTLVGSLGDDQLFGLTDNDSILGGDGRDLLEGGDGNDVVSGEGSSFDSVSGGLGNDTLGGGSGTDALVETADVNFTLTSVGLTGLGTDTLAGFEQAILTGGANANVINAATFTGSVSLYGGAGNDTLTGGSFADYFSGEAGNDSVIGNAGNDSMLGGAGADLLNGGDGLDTLLGQGGSLDTLLGGLGNDSLDGGVGNDKLFGEGGNDTLRGLDGLDYLSGGDQDDSLLGGLGDDTLLGEGGNDTLNGGDGNDILDGGEGNDGLSGFTGNDNLTGALGTDTLYGGAGNDSLFGGGGTDIVIGEADADAVNGNSGTDTLVGGSGTGTADAGDTFSDVADIDETFKLVPVPDWVARV